MNKGVAVIYNTDINDEYDVERKIRMIAVWIEYGCSGRFAIFIHNDFVCSHRFVMFHAVCEANQQNAIRLHVLSKFR